MFHRPHFEKQWSSWLSPHSLPCLLRPASKSPHLFCPAFSLTSCAGFSTQWSPNISLCPPPWFGISFSNLVLFSPPLLHLQVLPRSSSSKSIRFALNTPAQVFSPLLNCIVYITDLIFNYILSYTVNSVSCLSSHVETFSLSKTEIKLFTSFCPKQWLEQTKLCICYSRGSVKYLLNEWMIMKFKLLVSEFKNSINSVEPCKNYCHLKPFFSICSVISTPFSFLF